MAESPDEDDVYVEKQLEKEQTDPCGWGPWKPVFCQRFRDPRWVLVILCMAAAVQGMIVNGFLNVVISNLEKRFEISSTASGTIVSCYDVSTVLFLIPVSYFGGMGVKPRYVGLGIFILGLGSLIFALPHFTTDHYIIEVREETICRLGTNSSFTCSGKEETTLSNYKYVFYLAQLLHGIGSTPLYVLGVTYMDENVPMRSSSLYVAIFYTCSVVGPAIGYVAGGGFLKYFTDIGSVDVNSLSITPENPRWVGAWWIGFLLTSIMAFVIFLPLTGFPRTLPGSSKYIAERGHEAHKGGSSVGTMLGQTRGIKDILLSLKSLACNPTFIFLSLSGACEGMIVSGFSAFAPKFIESQFNLPASIAGQYVGYAVVPAGGGGTLFGGYLVKRFNMKMTGILKMCLIITIVCCGVVVSFLVTCDSQPFAGINVPYGKGYRNITSDISGNLEDRCNQDCGCTQEDYHPVCGRDEVMYFSPCYAGCETSEDGKYFYNCSCIESNATQYAASLGKCESYCIWLPVFMPFFGLLIFLTFFTTMPAVTATLRCVTPDLRSFGLGIQSIIIRTLGSIPGPILFGKIIDLTCRLWQQTCEGSGSCFAYDNSKMGHYLLALGAVLKILSAIFFFMSFILYKSHRRSEENSEKSITLNKDDDSSDTQKDDEEFERDLKVSQFSTSVENGMHFSIPKNNIIRNESHNNVVV